MTETPSTVVVIDKKTAKVVDSEGRTLTVKMLSAVQRMKLFGALGPDKSLVDRYLVYASIAASVIMIDETPIPFPTTAGQVEAIVGRLDDSGIEAVAEAIGTLTPKREDVASAAENL